MCIWKRSPWLFREEQAETVTLIHHLPNVPHAWSYSHYSMFFLLNYVALTNPFSYLNIANISKSHVSLTAQQKFCLLHKSTHQFTDDSESSLSPPVINSSFFHVIHLQLEHFTKYVILCHTLDSLPYYSVLDASIFPSSTFWGHLSHLIISTYLPSYHLEQWLRHSRWYFFYCSNISPRDS